MNFLTQELKNKKLFFGIVFLSSLLIISLLGFLFPYHQFDMNLKEELTSPSFKHLLGQDLNGRDILKLIIQGARYTLSIALIINFVSLIVGTSLGLISGYFENTLGRLIDFLVDFAFSFPGMLLAMGITALTGGGFLNIIIAIATHKWAVYARFAKAETLAIKKMDYIIAARALGATNFRILFKHILPNILSTLIVQATFAMASIIMIESSLSFLGMGLPQTIPSWGILLSTGRDVILEAPHVAISSGFAIMITIFSFNLFGEGMNGRLNPSRR